MPPLRCGINPGEEGRKAVGNLSVGEGLLNEVDDALYVVENLVVPESEDSIAVRFQILGPLGIFGRLPKMLAAIKLDDQVGVGRTEVHDEAAYGMLPSESDPICALQAQICPEPGFRGGWIIAELGGAVHQPWG